MCWRLLSCPLPASPIVTKQYTLFFSSWSPRPSTLVCYLLEERTLSFNLSTSCHFFSFPPWTGFVSTQLPFAVKNKDILLCAKWESNVSAGEDWVGLGQHQQTNFRPLPSLLITNNVLDPASSTTHSKIRKNTGESLEVRSEKRNKKRDKKRGKRDKRETMREQRNKKDLIGRNARDYRYIGRNTQHLKKWTSSSTSSL